MSSESVLFVTQKHLKGGLMKIMSDSTAWEVYSLFVLYCMMISACLFSLAVTDLITISIGWIILPLLVPWILLAIGYGLLALLALAI